MKKTPVAATLFLGLCLINSHSQAAREHRKTAAALMKACKNDISRFCKSAEADLKKINCLRENEKYLSADCGKTLKGMPQPEQKDKSVKDRPGRRKAEAALMKACKDDISRFCKDVKSGPKQGSCLMKNESELSSGCGKTLKSLPQPNKKDSDRRQAEAALKKACKDDLGRFCAGVESSLKQGNCLMEYQSELSADCGKALKSLPPVEQEAGGKDASGRQEAEAALKKACKDDLGRFCAGVESSLKRGGCLIENETELSDDCAKALKSLPPPKQENEPGKN